MGSAPSWSATTNWATGGSRARAIPSCCSPKTRPTTERLFGSENQSPYVKDGYQRLRGGRRESRSESGAAGTKAAARYRLSDRGGGDAHDPVAALCRRSPARPFRRAFEETFAARHRGGRRVLSIAWRPKTSAMMTRSVQRQAFAGLLWSKQFYNYDVRPLAAGRSGASDASGEPPPRPQQRTGRISTMRTFVRCPTSGNFRGTRRGIWRFTAIPLALVDPDFAKEQLLLLLREWYMHPNGQLPAYEWNFSDANPPVHAWAAWRIYRIEQRQFGRRDRAFLERVFHKLLLNFTWWVNRKDADGQQRISGRVSRTGQHRRIRSQHDRARRRRHRAVRRHQLDGRCTA